MRFQLSNSSEDRVGVFVCSFVTLVFCGFMFYLFHDRVPAGDWVERLIRFLMLEVYFTFALFGIYGLLWSMMAPRWLSNALRSTFRRITLLVYTLVAAGVLGGIYLLFISA